MKLDLFIEHLQKFQAEGHGEKQVYYRVGSSGACGELGNAHVTDMVDDCGPFDLDAGEEYIEIYAGS